MTRLKLVMLLICALSVSVFAGAEVSTSDLQKGVYIGVMPGFSVTITNEWILNAGAQWHWKRPGLRFILDGYDLLHQISRISYVINAQGRTESWDNTIPRYAMLRIIYQFNASK